MSDTVVTRGHSRIWTSAFIALTLAISTRSAIAQEKIPAEFEVPVARVAEIVADLAAGATEDAYERWQQMLPQRHPTPKTPLDPDPYVPFQRLFGTFAKELDSLDFVAHRRISSAAVKLTFVANTRFGPILLEVLAYRYQGEWRFVQITIQELSRLEPDKLLPFNGVMPFEALPHPIAVPLPPRTAVNAADAK